MAKRTSRDVLWNYALKQTHRKGVALSPAKLANMAGTTERSARDVLKTMADMEFVKERKKGREVTFVANNFTEPSN